MSIFLLITTLLGGIYVLYLCFYMIRNNNKYDNVLKILNRMIKTLEKKHKPKNPNSFWKTYTDESEEIKEDIKSLKKEFTDIKKHNYWIPIGIAILLLFFTGFNSWLYYNEVTEVTQESLISDVTGLESIKRMGNDELYQINLHNYGSTEENVEITISFYIEVKIIEALNIDEDARKIKEEIRAYKSQYYVHYSKMYANENITIRLTVTSDEFIKNQVSLIYPYKIDAFTDDGKIQIYRDS